MIRKPTEEPVPSAQPELSWTGTVHCTVEASVATLVIDHGERNLLNPGLMAELRETLLAVDASPEINGIVLTGAGTLFCGGLDVQAIQAGADPRDFASALVALLQVFPHLKTPIAAAVNGDAVASGASLVAACDYAVAVSDARIGTYEVSVGIWPMIAQVPLVHRIGARAAMENIGAGEPFGAQRAYELGLVQKVVGPDQVGQEALAWLGKASRAGANAASRVSLYELAEMAYADALDESLARFVAQF